MGNGFMNLSETIELYHKYQLSGMQENQIKAIFEGLDIRDKNMLTNEDLRLFVNEFKKPLADDIISLGKELFQIKMILIAIVIMTIIPTVIGLLS